MHIPVTQPIVPMVETSPLARTLGIAALCAISVSATLLARSYAQDANAHANDAATSEVAARRERVATDTNVAAQREMQREGVTLCDAVHASQQRAAQSEARAQRANADVQRQVQRARALLREDEGQGGSALNQASTNALSERRAAEATTTRGLLADPYVEGAQ